MNWVRWLLALALAGCGGFSTSPDAAADGGGGPPVRSCQTAFRYQATAAKVAVGGEWNRFDPTQTPMHGPDHSGAWTAEVQLPPGSYAYKLVVDGNWSLDPANPYAKYVSDIETSVVEVGDCLTPEVEFRALSKSADGALHAEAQYIDGQAQDGLDRAALTVLLDGQPALSVDVSPSGRIAVDA